MPVADAIIWYSQTVYMTEQVYIIISLLASLQPVTETKLDHLREGSL